MNKEEQAVIDSYKGYSLFNDQPEELRIRNRAVILANIAEDYLTKEKKIAPKGAALMIGYFAAIPLIERKAASAAFAEAMKQRNFAIVNEPAQAN